MLIDLRQFEALRAVHLEGSVTGAARRLGWSQPTVDYHLKNLDRAIGSPVLQRSSRGSRPTPVGMLLLERGQEILTLSERAVRDARELAQMGRVRLRFGTFPTAASKLLPSIAAHVNNIGIEIDAVLEECPPLVERMNSGELDAALVYTVPGYDLPFRPHVATVEVHRDPLLLALPAGHPLAARPTIDLPALLSLGDERWLFAAAPNDPMDSIVIDAFAARGKTLEVAIRTDDFQVMLGMIVARMAIGLLPRLAVGPSHPGVVLRPFDDPAFVRSLLVATPAEGPQRRPSAATRQLLAAIRDSCAELQARDAGDLVR